jgi:hypothetical protein
VRIGQTAFKLSFIRSELKGFFHSIRLKLLSFKVIFPLTYDSFIFFLTYLVFTINFILTKPFEEKITILKSYLKICCCSFYFGFFNDTKLFKNIILESICEILQTFIVYTNATVVKKPHGYKTVFFLHCSYQLKQLH